MKYYGFIALLLTIIYAALGIAGIFTDTMVDLRQPSGRLIAFLFFVMHCFATGVFIALRNEKKWFDILSIIMLFMIWTFLLLILLLYNMNWEGPTFG